MGVLDWFRRNGSGKEDPRLTAWRMKWTTAAVAGDTSAGAVLARELESLGLSDDDAEIEREMLDALECLGALKADVDAMGLPQLSTGHRVVGFDVCHFIGPVSMPDEAAQPSGRLLLTSARAISSAASTGRPCRGTPLRRWRTPSATCSSCERIVSSTTGSAATASRMPSAPRSLRAN